MEKDFDQWISLFQELFDGRRDCYGVQPGKSEKQPLTHDVLLGHLKGGKRIGVYPLVEDKCKFTAIDLDNGNFQHALRIKNELGSYSLPAYIECSKSKGYHVWLFFSDWIRAKKAREALKVVLNGLGIKAEIFPKQNSPTDGGFGNYIYLPFFDLHNNNGKAVFLDEDGQPFPDQIYILQQIQLANPDILERIIQENTQKERKKDISPSVIAFHKDPFSKILSQCEYLDGLRWKIKETGDLEHIKRIYFANVFLPLPGGRDWITNLFSALSDFDPKITERQLDSLMGKPILCSTMCNKRCKAIEERNAHSPIAFAFQKGNGKKVEEAMGKDRSTNSGGFGGIGDEWDIPILFQGSHGDPLPIQAFPPWIRDYCQSLAEFTQTPSDMTAILSLCACAAAVAKKGVVEVRPRYTEPLNIWGTVILPPAHRKSPVFGKINAPIYAHEQTLAREIGATQRQAINKKNVFEKRLEQAKMVAAKAKIGGKLEDALQEVQKIQEQLDALIVPSIPRLLASDVTTERLAGLMMENHGRIAVLSPEGDIFKLMSGRYSKTGATNFEHYKKAWTGNEPIRDDRMTRKGTYVRNPALTLGITIQPSVLESLVHKEAFKGEGLLGRFLYGVPPSIVGYRKTGQDVPPLNEEYRKQYEEKMEILLKTTPAHEDEYGEWEPHTLKLSPSALTVHDAFEAEVEILLRPEGELGGMTDWGGKLVGNITRVAGVLHLAGQAERLCLEGNPNDVWGDDITEDAMRHAVEIGRALISHAKAAYDLMEVSLEVRLAKYVLKRILTAPNQKDLTIRDVWQQVKDKSEIQTMSDLEPILNLLEERNLIRIVPRESRGTGRPPSPYIKVNPKLTPKTPKTTKTGSEDFENVKDDGGQGDVDFDTPRQKMRNDEGFQEHDYHERYSCHVHPENADEGCFTGGEYIPEEGIVI